MSDPVSPEPVPSEPAPREAGSFEAGSFEQALSAAAPLRCARTTPPTVTWAGRLPRVIGLIAVVSSSAGPVLSVYPAVTVLAVAAWMAWAVWVVVPAGARRVGLACLVVMSACGGGTAAWLAGSMIVMLAMVFVGCSLSAEPPLIAVVIVATTVVTATGSYLIAGHTARGSAGLLGATAVVALMGWSRRQSRAVEEHNRILLEQNRIIRAERDRAAALAERGRIARDIHDVLAHTLGGLVLQLDAADALLEAGAVDRAADRVRASHRLAVSGLADARGVVTALRHGNILLYEEIQRLARDHRTTGGRVDLFGDTELRSLDEQATVAVLRAVQEALTNARKHAPGQPITITLGSGAEETEVRISNPIAAQAGSLARSGAGAGLLGMTERIAATGGTVRAGKEDGRWTVRIRIPGPRATT